MTLNCMGQLVDLSSPKIMGILNLTPDSFYDGGRYRSESQILNRVENMLLNGASFIDLGGYSSRPGADHLSEAEELNRVVPIIGLILKHFPDCLISIDTFRSEVAKSSVSEGAALVNDISAGQLDNSMMETVAALKVPYVMMHMRGTPQNMHEHVHYDDLLTDILKFFSERLLKAKESGIIDTIVDPGFGFSKTLDQNYVLMQQLESFHICDRPLLVGISRKSMIYKLLDSNPENALNGSTALHAVALLKGAHILRVHDVKEAYETVQIINKLRS